jgi:hypothetical protein
MERQKLLTELERQQQIVDELPESFEFPLFNSRRALESQRQSGYRNTAAAAREIVDNSIEAGAERVHVVFDRPTERGKHERKDRVTSVAFVDDGTGMLPKMARFALSWGGGSHFDDPDFIGKFGFGLPNASINQSRRVEVYTRTAPGEPIIMAWLDIDEYTGEGAVQRIPEPVQADLPTFVQRHLKEQNWTFERGTVVVWSRPDRLSYRTAAALRDHLLEDFGATYRYLLGDVRINVAGTDAVKVDPLFLDPAARYYVSPDKGGAQVIEEATLAVKYLEDPSTGAHSLVRVDNPAELADPNARAVGAIHIRVARLPLGLAVGRELEDGVAPLDEFSKARFEVRKSRRGMSFVRAKREIETVDVFPRRASDRASGLGNWPLLQSYAYHWGIEVRFPPSLDEVFGITHDKQSVRPVEEFWRLLARERFDELVQREEAWQSVERKKDKRRRDTARLARQDGTSSPAEVAARVTDVALGEDTDVPDRSKAAAREELDRRAHAEAKRTERSIEEARAALAAAANAQPYRVEYVEEANGPVYTPVWVGRSVVVQINKAHPFFSALYGTLLSIEGGALAKEAVDLLLITLAREELLTRNATTQEFYKVQRTERWSPFLATAIRTLSRDFAGGDEMEEAA